MKQILSLVFAAAGGGLIEYILNRFLAVRPSVRHLIALAATAILFFGLSELLMFQDEPKSDTVLQQPIFSNSPQSNNIPGDGNVVNQNYFVGPTATPTSLNDAKSGALVPAKDAFQDSCTHIFPASLKKIELGGTTVGLAKASHENGEFVISDIEESDKPLVLIEIGKEPVLWIEWSSNELYVSANIYGEDGRGAAQLVRNEFYIDSDSHGVFRISRPDEHELVIINDRLEEMFWIRYLAPNFIKVRGIFNKEDYPVVKIENDRILTQEGNYHAINNCVFAPTEGLFTFYDIEPSTSLYKSGMRLYHSGLIEESIKKLKKAVELNSSNIEALRALTIIHTNRGMHFDAELYATRLIDVAPENWESYLIRAEVRKHLDDVDSLLDDLFILTEHKPDVPTFWYFTCVFGELSATFNNEDACQRTVAKAENFDDPMFNQMGAIALFLIGDKVGSIQELNNVLKWMEDGNASRRSINTQTDWINAIGRGDNPFSLESINTSLDPFERLVEAELSQKNN